MVAEDVSHEAREAAQAVHAAAAELARAIRRAHDLGLRVDVDVISLRDVGASFTTPLLNVGVYEPIPAEGKL